MAEHKYIPSGISITCDKGTIPNALIVVNPTSTILGRQWATTADNVVGQSFQSFGNCACKSGMPCIPSVTKWLNTAGSDIVCIGNELLIDESELPCIIGGKITIALAPPPADEPKPPSGELSELKKKMGGIVGKLMAPINSLKGALNGAIGGIVGSALGGAVSDMTADAIGKAVGNKIASDIQAKAINKLMSKSQNKGSANQKLGNVKGNYSNPPAKQGGSKINSGSSKAQTGNAKGTYSNPKANEGGFKTNNRNTKAQSGNSKGAYSNPKVNSNKFKMSNDKKIQKFGNFKPAYPNPKVNPDEFIAVNINEHVSSLDFIIKINE